jgi:hypothetical protein
MVGEGVLFECLEDSSDQAVLSVNVSGNFANSNH